MAAIVAIAMVVGSLLTVTPAFAVVAGTGSLTVKGNDAFASVDAYQMFVVQGDTEGSAKYVLNGDWNDFFSSTNLTGFPADVAEDDLSDAAFTYIKGLGNDDAEKVNAFAKTAAAWATEHLSESSAPTKVSANADDGTNQATLSNLAFGYYLVVPNPKGSTPDGEHQNRGTDAMLVNVNENAQTMELKTVYPTVDKKVEDNANHASASVGDTLNFTLTSTVPDTSEYTDSYQFAFEDTLSKGLTFGNITSITIGETTLNAGTDYKLTQTVDDGTGETKLRIDFGTESGGIYNAKDLFDGKAGQKITVTYTATLNEKAQVQVDQTNTVKVVYSNNPGTNGTGESGESKTHQYTFGFDLNKTDGTNGLAGAQFQLKKDDDVIRLIAVAGQENTYRPAKDGESEGVVDTITTPEGGVIHFTGLAAGTYQLVETEAPEGYNKVADPIEVKIEATYHEDGKLQSWTVNSDGNHAIEVVNHAGAILPGTGGMGTVVFTVVGVAIVVCGAVWYVRRSKANS